MACAQAIEGGFFDVADSLLALIQSLASKEESIWTRKVVKYFAEALVRRAYRIRPPCPLISHPTKYEPLYEFAETTSKHAIADALNSGNKRLHIIDFSILFGFSQWNYLIRDLKRQRQIGNVVACEGVDRVERIESFAQWQNRLSQAGFCPVPQQVDKLKIGVVFCFHEYGIKEEEGHNILLSWHGCPVAVASVWKVTDPPQFSGGYWKNMLTGLYTMQDTVDDSEGMASSSESEDDEDNDSLVSIMADRNLWLEQGSSMNRIAASAKLFDVLEYTCDLHSLPLAVTWISYGQDGNTNSKEKRFLCIDDSAYYLNNWSTCGFVDEYARYRLEEGKEEMFKDVGS
ncbi:hypothetical protein NC651_030426 [Populus alba x Populus x berolinensis]|nr:hypothetical protein NC651_030426 [Populus alba x Populus x berolinensis]